MMPFLHRCLLFIQFVDVGTLIMRALAAGTAVVFTLMKLTGIL